MAQFTAMDAVPATGRFDAEEIVDGAFATVRPQLVAMLESLCGPVTPAMLFHFELIVFTLLREFGRVLLEKLFNSLEGDGSELPHDVMFSGQGGGSARRLATNMWPLCLGRSAYGVSLIDSGSEVSMSLASFPWSFSSDSCRA